MIAKEDYRLIPLTQGKYAKVDKEDYEYLSQWKWNVHVAKNKRLPPRYYAVRTAKNIKMHRVISGAQKSQLVDHINGDGLDNRKSNIRICTSSQNIFNRRPIGISGYKGVFCSTNTNRIKKWEAKITHNGNDYFIGRYKTKDDAALAYNNRAKELFGSFAYLNKVIQC